MIKSLSFKALTRIFVVTCCLALIDRRSDALLLGNFIGCNSFGCRLTALENDVNVLKQQVARLNDPNMHTMNNFRPAGTGGFNQNQGLFNQGSTNQSGQQSLQQNPQQQSGQQENQNNNGNNNNGGGGNRVNYANILSDFNGQQNLRRVNGYQNGPNNLFNQ